MSTDSEEEAKSDSDDDNDPHHHHQPAKQRHEYDDPHEHHQTHTHHASRGHSLSRNNDLDAQDDMYNRERDNESKISTQRSKVSKATLINHEHLKSNRLSTLVGAVSTNNLAVLNGNANASDKLKKVLKKKDSDEKTIELLNANNNDDQTSNALSLLKQIKHHQAKVASANHQNHHRKMNSANSKTNLTQAGSTSNVHSTKEMATAASGGGDLHAATDEISDTNLSKLTTAVLKLLNQLEIKFPGKNSDQTRMLVNTIYSKLDAYKPKLANYWMVKLDDSKRTKVETRLLYQVLYNIHFH